MRAVCTGDFRRRRLSAPPPLTVTCEEQRKSRGRAVEEQWKSRVISDTDIGCSSVVHVVSIAGVAAGVAVGVAAVVSVYYP